MQGMQEATKETKPKSTIPKGKTLIEVFAEEKAKKVDLVYIVNPKKSSMSKNGELKYSLRSACQHFKDIGKVFFVCEKLPPWAKGVRLIKASEPDVSKGGSALLKKEKCMTEKIETACKSKLVSKEFLRMCDDYVFMKDTTAEWLRKNPMARCDPDSKQGDFEGKFYYGKQWKKIGYSVMHHNCLRHIKELTKTALDYELHSPILIDKANGLEVIDALGTQITFCSAYGNMFIKKPFLDGMYGLKHRAQVRSRLSFKQVKELMEGKRFLNWNAKGLRHRELKSYLKNTFREPCRFEA